MLRHRYQLPHWLRITLITAGITLLFLATSDDPAIWPLRNLARYRVTEWLNTHWPAPQPAGQGQMHGCVYTAEGTPVPAATVLVAERTGRIHPTSTDAQGCYQLADIPAGSYVPLAAAPGYDPATARAWGMPIRIAANTMRHQDFTLPPVSLPSLPPGTNLRLSPTVTRTWELPQPGVALRRQLTYDSPGRAQPPTFLYTPITTTQQMPTLLAIYPGEALQWEGISIPLAAAGYAVIATAPTYTLDLDADVNDLQHLVAFTRAGKLPGTDGQRISVLGGSISTLHAFRLLQRDTGFRSAVMLGGISDLFELRQRFAEGSFFPPYGLDQAVIAFGPPNTDLERYWRYSPIYHLRPDMPPLAIIHSRDDEIVPVAQSERLVTALEVQAIPYEAYFFAGMPHYLLANRPSPALTRLYTFTLDFLEDGGRRTEDGGTATQ